MSGSRSDADVKAPEFTEAGKEVVFVWAEEQKNFSKEGRFQFMGAGAARTFGERWRLVAVMSGLAIFETSRRSGHLMMASSAGYGAAADAAAASGM